MKVWVVEDLEEHEIVGVFDDYDAAVEEADMLAEDGLYVVAVREFEVKMTVRDPALSTPTHKQDDIPPELGLGSMQGSGYPNMY